ncbi:hypothetical protein [Arenimonas terrae]|jgi:hypothetical protein|uniref:Uncharacterized protein n=1 Tax=Arenimonas terrae TaxID=2546226 RepID=A0A5C4RR32_9GAMM|nr:hypothetical protein [Arenimonas terrae]TNJ33572.1 hypothetical protein E1B00_09480 [Arenimonas terrae]
MSNRSKSPNKAPGEKLAKAIPAENLGQPHADLRDEKGKLLGAIVFKDGQWVLGLNGKIVGDTDSAAHVLAIIKRAAAMLRAQGREVQLVFSVPLREAADKEVAALGMSFEQFQARLEQDMSSKGAATP